MKELFDDLKIMTGDTVLHFPLGVKAVEWIDAPKLENVTLELRFEGEEVKNGSVQAE